MGEDVKILFSEAAKLVFQATQARHEEAQVIGDYTLISTRLDLAEQNGPKLQEVQAKRRELVQFEELARLIMLEGTFWKYNKVIAPGDNDKVLLDDATQQQAIEELARIAKTLADASYSKDQKSLKKMVKWVKDYVKKMRSSLTVYTNVAQLTKAIIYTESTITSCEDVIAREEGRTTRTSSREPSSYTTGSPSITTPSYTHDRNRARGAGHNKDRDIPDFMDKIAKIQHDAAHAPLRSTPAGEHSVSKSMIPISTYVGGPDDGDDDPSDDDSDYDDDDHGDRGRRGRDRDENGGSRRGVKRKRKQHASRRSGPVLLAPKMPGLDPKNYYWNGKTAFLRYPC